MSQRKTDFWLAVVASIAAFLLSWPFWRAFEYWPETRGAWRIYFVIGFFLAIYVFFVFLQSLHALFVHDAPGHGADGEEHP